MLEREVVSPSVEGDQLGGADGVSMPLADILRLEVHGFSAGRTVLVVLGTAATGSVASVVWVAATWNN